MAITLQDFKDYVGTKDATEYPQQCLDAGLALVVRFIGTVETVPDEVKDQATLVAASEIYHRRNSPQGISQFADGSGTLQRVNRDAMNAVYPLLHPYVGYAV
jgi:hypothetical protein